MKVILLVLFLPLGALAQIDVCKQITDPSGLTNRKTLKLNGSEPLEALRQAIKAEFDLAGKHFPYLIIEIPLGKYVGKKGLIIDADVIGARGLCLVGRDRALLKRTDFSDKTNDASGVVEIKDVSNLVITGFEIQGTIDTNNRGFSPAGIIVRNFSSNEVFNVSIRDNLINTIGHDYAFDSLSGYWRYKGDGDNHDNCRRTKPGVEDIRISCGHAHGIDINSVARDHPIRHIIVENNQLSNLRLGESEALTISNNVRDFNVSRNKIWDVDNIGIDIAGGHDSEFQPQNGVILNNEIRELKGTKELKGQNRSYPFIEGIYIDGGTGTDESNRIRIAYNTVKDFGIGITVGSENDYCDNNPSKCRHMLSQFIAIDANFLMNNRAYGLGIGKDGADQNSRTWNIQVYANSISGNLTSPEAHGYSEVHIGSLEKDSLKAIEFKRNIIVSKSGGLLVRVAGDMSNKKLYLLPDVRFDENLFYAEPPAKLIWSWGESAVKEKIYSIEELVVTGKLQLPPGVAGGQNIWVKQL